MKRFVNLDSCSKRARHLTIPDSGKIECSPQGECIMTKKDLDLIHKNLLDLKERLLSHMTQASSLRFETFEAGQDELEVCAHDVRTNLAFELQERERLQLLRIDRALQKIAAGTFGLCEACGCQITPERLKALPLARLCLDCMEELEKHQNPELH